MSGTSMDDINLRKLVEKKQGHWLIIGGVLILSICFGIIINVKVGLGIFGIASFLYGVICGLIKLDVNVSLE